jgi:hypothetical protein
MGFVLVTIALPAAAWWLAVRTESVELHWAVLGFGLTVVAVASSLYSISPDFWEFKGREGYLEDIAHKYSQTYGPGGFIAAVVLGLGVGEAAKAVMEWWNRPPQPSGVANPPQSISPDHRQRPNQ